MKTVLVQQALAVSNGQNNHDLEGMVNQYQSYCKIANDRADNMHLTEHEFTTVQRMIPLYEDALSRIYVVKGEPAFVKQWKRKLGGHFLFLLHDSVPAVV